MQDINTIRYESGDQVWHSADNPKYSLELVSGNAFDITVACIITNATGVRFTRIYADGSLQFERVCVLNERQIDNGYINTTLIVKEDIMNLSKL